MGDVKLRWIEVPSWTSWSYKAESKGFVAQVAWFEEGDARIRVSCRKKGILQNDFIEGISIEGAQNSCAKALASHIAAG